MGRCELVFFTTLTKTAAFLSGHKYSSITQRSQIRQLCSALTKPAAFLSARKDSSFTKRSQIQQLFSALTKTAALLSAHKYSSFSLLSQRRQLSSALMHRQVSSRSARKTGLLLAALTKKEGPVSAETTQTIMSTAQFS